ncbi:WYL domain-containing protein [Sulfurimonas sp. HSL-3221]|uniref:WYL domain-containing protein n=1 Tax=Sulfurimonadaceae TaxID=2771471 RepID=UPI001E3133CC|nr:WYL domain-containing protein [Sulfurimonas sp. HSL-3221]UFS62745.1 WYL domain-containing protein [Sulfurimonas sp. HSL-3221]
MKYKAQEVVVIILNELSRSQSVVLSSFADFYDVNELTLARNFRDVRDHFYSDDIEYVRKEKLWIAKRPRFLDDSFIKAEEAVVLTGILKNSSHFGHSLSQQVGLIVNYYKKRRYYNLLQPDTIEDAEPMKSFFATVEMAIRAGQYINLHYRKNGEIKQREVLPIRIANMEYYWYLIGEFKTDSGKEIRYLAFRKIEKIEPINSYAKYSVLRELRHQVKDSNKGMNAFYKPYQKHKKVKVMIPEHFEEYIKSTPYFSTWKRATGSKIIEDKKYIFYNIITTDGDEYRDIIPTIQKYMPDVVVCNNDENQELIRIMRERSLMYAKLLEESGS